MKNFRCFQMAKKQYLQAKDLNLPRYMKDQLNRASLSVCLNLAEGSVKSSLKDRRRFYEMAFASHRECQALLELIQNPKLNGEADLLGGALYCLIGALTAEAENGVGGRP